MRFKKLLATILVVVVGIIPVSVIAADNPSSIFQRKRVVVVSRESTKEDTDASLNNYRHKKVKSLTNYEGAEVVFVNDAEMEKLKDDNTIDVFEDAEIEVSKPDENIKYRGATDSLGSKTCWGKCSME